MYCSMSQSVLDVTILIQCIELDDLTLLIEGIHARLRLFPRVVHPTDALQESVRRDYHVVSHVVRGCPWSFMSLTGTTHEFLSRAGIF